MEEYNQLIASHVLDGIEKGIIKSTPQPTMFGGKRMRKWVLPGSTEFDYPGTLSVGSLDGNRSDTLGGSFWKDFGHGFKQGFTGTAKAIAPIAVPIAKELLLAKMRGAGYDSCSDDEMEGGMLVGADGHGIYHGAHMMPEAGLSRADGREMGGARDKDPVREYMKTIGSVINPALLVGLGMPGADGHGVRKMGGATPAEKMLGATNPLLWGYDLGKDVIAPALMKVIPPKKGRGRMVKGSPEAKAYMASIRAKKMGGSKSSGFVQRMVAVDQQGDAEEKEKLEKYRPFDLSAIQDYTTPFLSPSQNLRTTYAKKKKGRPQKHATAEEAYKAKLESNRIKRAEKRAMAKAEKSGGAMIMNHPGEFHSASYPPALASYRHQMAVGGKKGSLFSGFAKAVAPVAKDVLVPVAKEVATDYLRNKMRGGKKSSLFGSLVKDVVVPVGKEVATEYIRGKMRGSGLPRVGSADWKAMIAHVKSGQALSALGLPASDIKKLIEKELDRARDNHPALMSALQHVAGASDLADFAKSAVGGKKSSFLGDLGKAFAPVAKDVIVPVGKELATEFIRNKMRGGKSNAFIKGFAKVVSPVAKTVGEEIVVPLAKEAIRNKMRGGARSARNEIVKKIMMEKGLSLPMASKFVKEHGLY